MIRINLPTASWTDLAVLDWKGGKGNNNNNRKKQPLDTDGRVGVMGFELVRHDVPCVNRPSHFVSSSKKKGQDAHGCCYPPCSQNLCFWCLTRHESTSDCGTEIYHCCTSTAEREAVGGAGRMDRRCTLFQLVWSFRTQRFSLPWRCVTLPRPRRARTCIFLSSLLSRSSKSNSLIPFHD